jgi:hypothetical protein
MLKSFIDLQKSGDNNKVKNLIVPNVKLTQEPSAKYMNIKGVFQCDIMEWKMDDNEFRYVLCFVNTVSGQGFCYTLQRKTADAVVAETEKFIKTHRDIKFLESDNGGEFVNAKFQHLMKYWGIIHKTSFVGKHTQTAKIDNYIYQLRKLVNASLIASSRKSWKAVIDDARKHLNNFRILNTKERKMSDFFKLPILPKQRELLNVGDEVHVKKMKHDETMRYRVGNAKFDNEVRKIENVLLRNGQTVKYRVSGIKTALFDRNEINKHV